MPNWIGVPLFLLGAGLIYSGLSQRARVLAVRRKAAAVGEIETPASSNHSLAGFGYILRALVIIGLGYFALKATLVYALLGDNRLFSLFDLAGLLFLVAGYGTWLFLTTTYREAVGSRAAVVPPLLAAVDQASGEDLMIHPAVRSESKQDALVS
jgi:hypothetical protein